MKTAKHEVRDAPELEHICRELEHFETDRWCVDAILQRINLGDFVVDPCTGSGILAEAALETGATVMTFDIFDWGAPIDVLGDFLDYDKPFPEDTTVFMNPPFSKASDFVAHAFSLGAERILGFQRLAWLESKKRQQFWTDFSPLRIYLCGERATCWRHDISQEERDSRGGTPTPHAWFYWTRESLGRNRPEFKMIYKNGDMV